MEFFGIYCLWEYLVNEQNPKLQRWIPLYNWRQSIEALKEDFKPVVVSKDEFENWEQSVLMAFSGTN